ncbi:MAG: CHAT domain-containing protein [Saprospiraceae bacterium]|nr:CHAT domain-containing protein [Saprospiraceae bacterium]
MINFNIGYKRNHLCLLLFFITGQLNSQNHYSLKIKIDSLITNSRNLSNKNDYTNATISILQALEIANSEFGSKSKEYADVCFNYGRIFHLQNDFEKAELWYRNSLNIRKKAPGKNHPDYAWSLNNIAIVKNTTGEFNEALALSLEATQRFLQTVGPRHSDYAMSIRNLALIYTNLEDYDKAIEFNAKSMQLSLDIFSNTHMEYAKSAANLALLYSKVYQYEKAENIYIKIKELFDTSLIQNKSNYARLLSNYGLLKFNMAQYEKAEPLFLDAKLILDEINDTTNTLYAQILSNLGAVYNRLSLYVDAEIFYNKALSIKETIYGQSNLEYGFTLLNLAELQLSTKDYTKCELSYNNALSICKKLQATNNDFLIKCKLGLCKLYIAIKDYEKSLHILLELKNELESISQTQSFEYIKTLHFIGVVYQNTNKSEKAESFFEEALSGIHKIFGTDNSLYANEVYALAIFYKISRNFEKAETYFQKLTKLDVTQLTKAAIHLSEKELTESLEPYIETQSELFDLANISEESNSLNTSKLTEYCYNSCLFYKGFILTEIDKIRNEAYLNSNLKSRIAELQSCESIIAAELSKPKDERKLLSPYYQKSKTIQKELALKTSVISQNLEQVEWQDVQKSLKQGEVAIEYFNYRIKNENDVYVGHYAAIFIKPGLTKPKFIYLCNSEELEKLFSHQSDHKADYVNELYTSKARGAQLLKNKQKDLFQLIWKPIMSDLTNVNKIYYSLSGLLHKINIAAIPIEGELAMMDKFEILPILSTRQLVRSIQKLNKENQIVLYGGIQYELDSQNLNTKAFEKGEYLTTTRNAANIEDEETPHVTAWEFLNSTKKEVYAINIIAQNANFKTSILQDYSATEESIKNLGHIDSISPRALHISTHGFYFPKPKLPLPTKNEIGEKNVLKQSENPMLRSGLILSRANYAWNTGIPYSTYKEDGILTAQEISQMNLKQTELVVLSACETGLGDIQDFEGVYGLQRGFKIAGAKYLILSLWKVADRETSEFMIAFYKNWLEKKLDIPTAFRTTELEMRDRFINPYLWAGFILIQ